MKKLSFIIIMCFCLGFGYAQEENSATTNYSADVFNSEQEGLNVLSNIFLQQPNTNALNTTLTQNQVLIQQIGVDNVVNAQTTSISSSLNLIQNGNFNTIDINISAPQITESIVQNGNNNRVLDNIYYTNRPVELNLIQNGNNLTLNRIGVNSLTNRLQFVQEGSFKTITIISN